MTVKCLIYIYNEIYCYNANTYLKIIQYNSVHNILRTTNKSSFPSKFKMASIFFFKNRYILLKYYKNLVIKITTTCNKTN